MMRTILLVTGATALFACNKSPEIHERNASVEQVAVAAQKANAARGIMLNAGQWRLTGKMEEMTIPGMPASAQADMQRMIGDKNNFTMEYCLTPEQARKPKGDFFGGKKSENCRYERFDMAGGKIEAVMRCEGQPSCNMTMKIDGTYAADSYATNVAMDVADKGHGGISMKMRSEAHRIGECTAEQLKAAAKEGNG